MVHFVEKELYFLCEGNSASVHSHSLLTSLKCFDVIEMFWRHWNVFSRASFRDDFESANQVCDRLLMIHTLHFFYLPSLYSILPCWCVFWQCNALYRFALLAHCAALYCIAVYWVRIHFGVMYCAMLYCIVLKDLLRKKKKNRNDGTDLLWYHMTTMMQKCVTTVSRSSLTHFWR